MFFVKLCLSSLMDPFLVQSLVVEVWPLTFTKSSEACGSFTCSSASHDLLDEFLFCSLRLFVWIVSPEKRLHRFSCFSSSSSDLLASKVNPYVWRLWQVWILFRENKTALIYVFNPENMKKGANSVQLLPAVLSFVVGDRRCLLEGCGGGRSCKRRRSFVSGHASFFLQKDGGSCCV